MMPGVFNVVDWLSAPYTLYLVLRDNSASTQTKVRAGIILAFMAFYILNPLDLIPDLQPILGWIDDLIILPLGMAVAQKAVPEIDLGIIRVSARARVKKVVLWTVAAGAGLMILGTTLLTLAIWQLLK